MSQLGVKVYECPKINCDKSEPNFYRLKHHIMLDHELVIKCSQIEFERTKGKGVHYEPATLEQMKEGWKVVNRKSDQDWQDRIDDGRIDLKGKAIVSTIVKWLEFTL